MNLRKLLLLLAIIIILFICFLGSKGELVENLNIPIGIGLDIDKSSDYRIYSMPFSTYFFEDNKFETNIFTTKASTIGEVRELRQLKSPKQTMTNLKIFVISEDAAMDGLKNLIEINLNNPLINDRAICCVCKGKSENILNFKSKGYSNPSEFIDGLIHNLKYSSFFPMQYSVMDIIVRFCSEGRNTVLPYITVENDDLKVAGLAIFKKDKMVGLADLDESKIINLLKESNVSGMITLRTSPDHYVNCYTISKQKVKCTRENNNVYNFTINLKLKGNIIANQLYKDLYQNEDMQEKLKTDMERYVESLCNEEISKIIKKYKTDVLDLGRVAAAKYGRNSNTDWDKVICSSHIKVNVDFSVDTNGRGSTY